MSAELLREAAHVAFVAASQTSNPTMRELHSAIQDWLNAEATSQEAIGRMEQKFVRESHYVHKGGAGIELKRHDDGTVQISVDTLAPALRVARIYLGHPTT